MLYFNILFRQLILKIDCYTMMIGLDRKIIYFAHNYQKIVIVKHFQNFLVRCIKGGVVTIATDLFFILENIMIEFQMDADKFSGLLYNIL